jgi:hypothetical protein
VDNKDTAFPSPLRGLVDLYRQPTRPASVTGRPVLIPHIHDYECCFHSRALDVFFQRFPTTKAVTEVYPLFSRNEMECGVFIHNMS